MSRKASYVATYHKDRHFLLPDIRDYNWTASPSSNLTANIDNFTVEPGETLIELPNNDGALLAYILRADLSKEENLSIKVQSLSTPSLEVRPDIILSQPFNQFYAQNDSEEDITFYVFSVIPSGAITSTTNTISIELVSSFLDLSDTFTSYDGRDGHVLIIQDGKITSTDISNVSLPIYLQESTVYTCSSSVEELDAVYIDSEGVIRRASRDNADTLPVVGFVTTKPTSTTCTIQTLGHLDGFEDLTPGQTYYLEYNGGITTEVPDDSGEILYVVGVAKDSEVLTLRYNTQNIII